MISPSSSGRVPSAKAVSLEEFRYDLPEDLIAQEPLKERDASRLLVVERRTGLVRHSHFRDLRHVLPAGSLIVLNNSRVIPARLLGEKARSGGEVEIFLLRRMGDEAGEGICYEVLLRPGRRIRDGDVITFPGSVLTAEVVDKERRVVRLTAPDVLAEVERIGHVPLPPYIRRADRPADRETYQTVYAKNNGSVAAPTAGLHFTPSLLDALKAAGHDIAEVTLHVGYGTFQPVETEDITQHPMHAETYAIPARTVAMLESAREHGRPVVAVGTTSCRVLETWAQTGQVQGETQMFIYPGYGFRAVNALVTNFHLPASTLLMLVYAFGSTDLMRRAYQEAIRERYRFYSYGDAMVIV